MSTILWYCPYCDAAVVDVRFQDSKTCITCGSLLRMKPTKEIIELSHPEQVELLRYAMDRFTGTIPEDRLLDNCINDWLRYRE